ncbi:hypothetical protein SAMN04488168_11740 [Bacillus sp. 491mf]|uniref:hypothetical protein n=1 Tax=Bacillus TaxID=1386 RepID=UPI0005521D93|nr:MULTISPECIES: hypothetical protein [unclassified Bacillus (in: firmicutes)]SFD08473.1 hypothetical protein SAMN04488168_11740 [Bacillus sp. 491mf]
MKKGFVIGIIGLFVVSGIAYMTGDAAMVYPFAGWLGLFFLASAVFLCIDGFILGARGTFTSAKPTRKESRFQSAKMNAFAAIPNMAASLGVYLWLS